MNTDLRIVRESARTACRLAVAIAVVSLAAGVASGADFPVPRAVGRLHPALVHFPIGLLLVALMVEVWSVARRKPGPSPVALTCASFGALGAAAAAAAGWFNADFEHAANTTIVLGAHRWTGVAAACFALIAMGSGALGRWKTGATPVYRAALVLAAACVGVAGHFGGTMVHGEAYLGDAIAAITRTRPASATVVSGGAVVDLTGVRFPEDGRIDFERHVRPILAQTCFECHGASKRRGSLRLDSRVAAITGGKNGSAIKPGDSAGSLLIKRVLGEGQEQRMPLDMPALADDHVRILRAWIDQGATWPEHLETHGGAEEQHWAYVKPARPPSPVVARSGWVRNPIDAFAARSMESRGLSPSPEADKAVIARRVWLDITGLPPTLDELDAYLADPAPDAYERLVDKLLGSPAYGEKWAMHWLDLARYADSHGYEKDNSWVMWPYRDWVIEAIRADMPFDRFTIEQLAGDLLPEAKRDQLIATGFHRCSMINEEGGVDPEETRVATVIDRTNTTAAVWLGATFGCAQCHDHKYDPVTQKDYYSFFAFFNNSPGETQAFGSGETQVTSHKLVIPRPEEERWKQDAAAIEAKLATLAEGDESRKTVQAELDAIRAKLNNPLTTQVMKELETPRESHVLLRGSFLSPGERVEPAVPAAFPQITGASGRLSRLELARWLVSVENPLTARVHVNRIWSRYFGRGLVETEEDFGTRGGRPSHPELLDFLACEFMESGWSQRHIHRLIVTSATYRQSAAVSPAMLEADPANTLLARGPRFRLDAELVRDQALAVSGLLSRKVGGPSVYPSQPDGIWGHAYSGESWQASSGEDRHRRGVYTFWKRATPYPTFMSFDAPNRQVSCARRPRTNTPLQALTTLNDPAFMECAAALARRVLVEAGARPADRVVFAFRAALARSPRPEEIGRLVGLYQQQRARFAADPGAAHELVSSLGVGGVADADEIELAAWTMLANVLMNLDEFVTKG